MNLENSMLYEKKSDTKNHISDNSIYMKPPEQANSDTKSRLVVARIWGERELRNDCFQVSFWVDKNLLELVLIFAQICEYILKTTELYNLKW